MSVEVANRVVYPPDSRQSYEPESSSGDTEEFIKSVKDSLQRGRYDTATRDDHCGVVGSEDEQPSLPSDYDLRNDNPEHGGSLVDLVDFPNSDDEQSRWLSPEPLPQKNLLRVKQMSPGSDDIVLSYPKQLVSDKKDNGVDVVELQLLENENRQPAEASNHCHEARSPISKLQRRATHAQLPNKNFNDRLKEFLLLKRSNSCSQIDVPFLPEEAPTTSPDKEIEWYENGKSKVSIVESIDELPVRNIPKRRSTTGSSVHRFSETSTLSDNDSFRRRSTLSLQRRFSNYSVATTSMTTCSNFSTILEPDSAIDLAEALFMNIFDNDDIDGLIPPRFLVTNPDAIVDNIREEIFSGSYSPSASCDHSSSLDEDIANNFNFHASELGSSDLRLSCASTPRTTSSPRSSRHSKSASPERTEPVSSFPIEGGPPRTSMFSMNSMLLDTVEEETASQISPSPRLLSPRMSIDLGDSFDLASEMRSKPQQTTSHRLSVPHTRKVSLQREHSPREHHRYSVDSMVSENSFYFSVTSFDDDIKGKMDQIDDPTSSPKVERRHRKLATVATPPNSSVLNWLANMPKDNPPILDPDEPWPFNEGTAHSSAPCEVSMEFLTVPERKPSLSESSDLSFHSCRDDYAPSNISGQDSIDYAQLDSSTHTDLPPDHSTHGEYSTDSSDKLPQEQPVSPRIRPRLIRHRQAPIDEDDVI